MHFHEMFLETFIFKSYQYYLETVELSRENTGKIILRLYDVESTLIKIFGFFPETAENEWFIQGPTFIVVTKCSWG